MPAKAKARVKPKGSGRRGKAKEKQAKRPSLLPRFSLPASDHQDSQLLHFPAEIRLNIWRCLGKRSGGLEPCPTLPPLGHNIGIVDLGNIVEKYCKSLHLSSQVARLCQLAYVEYESILYGENVLHLRLDEKVRNDYRLERARPPCFILDRYFMPHSSPISDYLLADASIVSLSRYLSQLCVLNKYQIHRFGPYPPAAISQPADLHYLFERAQQIEIECLPWIKSGSDIPCLVDFAQRLQKLVKDKHVTLRGPCSLVLGDEDLRRKIVESFLCWRVKKLDIKDFPQQIKADVVAVVEGQTEPRFLWRDITDLAMCWPKAKDSKSIREKLLNPALHEDPEVQDIWTALRMHKADDYFKEKRKLILRGIETNNEAKIRRVTDIETIRDFKIDRATKYADKQILTARRATKTADEQLAQLLKLCRQADASNSDPLETNIADERTQDSG